MSVNTDWTVDVAIVGVDGSENSLAALSWVSDLVPAGGTIHIVTVGVGADRRSEREDAWLSPLSGRGIELQLHLADHDPAAVVTEFADATGAGLIALGAHSGAPRLPKAVGGVVHKTLRRAHCPVAVVRESPRQVGPVVVGVGDSPTLEPATAWAARLAGHRQVPLELVRVVNFHPFLGVNDATEVLASYIDPGQLVTWAEEELATIGEQLEGTGTKSSRHIASGDVGTVLVKRSEQASALVVGKHFDGKVTGFFTGRTVHHVLTHATCPVVVVPGHVD